jgi:hypothetical protein
MQKLLDKVSGPMLFILIGAASRLFLHPPNFTPIAAMALFGGVYLNRKSALVFPLLALFFSDIFIGFAPLDTAISVYGSFLLVGLIGRWLREHRSPLNIIKASFLSSILFFLITNFSVWVFWNLYPKTLPGLLEDYMMALPFFRNTLMGDLFYTGVFFGGYELLRAAIGRKGVAILKVRP